MKHQKEGSLLLGLIALLTVVVIVAVVGVLALRPEKTLIQGEAEAAEYRDSLTSWLGSIDIVYVLQFETDANVVEYLKKQLIVAIERETTPRRLGIKARILGDGLDKRPVYHRSTTRQLAANYGGGAGMICRIYSAMKGYADYLRGNAPGPSFWTHPDCPLYLQWYNRYDAPTSGLYRVQ